MGARWLVGVRVLTSSCQALFRLQVENGRENLNYSPNEYGLNSSKYFSLTEVKRLF